MIFFLKLAKTQNHISLDLLIFNVYYLTANTNNVRIIQCSQL